ncbi:ABC transporter ATP-binding protein [Sporolactobacillus laevolacticus]|uniref:ABC transporter ATP-binding protein n=1 Tax=Sporolactobacillus laevolacticus TaxID=33018 RepID=UPI0025B59067|nr:ATP-binding cassette domain-containing protein [Sporolactobacillus laevolacticus]MDN3954208.1 ATP-binding cassette domain-containing protein [Sporolactobacillus laevolacticus]
MPFLDVKNLKVHYPVRGGLLWRTVDYVRAVDGISFTIEKGQTYGLVGESGCGKTTTGRTVLKLQKATSGQIVLEGKDALSLPRRQLAWFRRNVQMIFQDPYSSLNPKKRVYDIIAEPLRNFEHLTKQEERRAVEENMERVGLSSDAIFKYPFEFSGGQRQRIGIARALTLRPQLLVCDEPVSALDVSVQAQVLNFMKDIQKEMNLTYLFISHDLGVIRHMCDRIGIMYRGRLVEEGQSEEIYERPQHIYTKQLIAAIPNIDPKQRGTQTEIRQTIERQYKENYENYFERDGRVPDLKQISATHFVATP